MDSSATDIRKLDTKIFCLFPHFFYHPNLKFVSVFVLIFTYFLSFFDLISIVIFPHFFFPFFITKIAPYRNQISKLFTQFLLLYFPIFYLFFPSKIASLILIRSKISTQFLFLYYLHLFITPSHQKNLYHTNSIYLKKPY